MSEARPGQVQSGGKIWHVTQPPMMMTCTGYKYEAGPASRVSRRGALVAGWIVDITAISTNLIQFC
jgi:hypothetical protein